MTKGRLEAFSDGVLAIVITIMVLELKVPHGSDLHALRPMVPVFLSYVLSFVYVGIYWTNHHHLFHATGEVDGGVLWANLALLFCLSLVPVVTAANRPPTAEPKRVSLPSMLPKPACATSAGKSGLPTDSWFIATTAPTRRISAIAAAIVQPWRWFPA